MTIFSFCEYSQGWFSDSRNTLSLLFEFHNSWLISKKNHASFVFDSFPKQTMSLEHIQNNTERKAVAICGRFGRIELMAVFE